MGLIFRKAYSPPRLKLQSKKAESPKNNVGAVVVTKRKDEEEQEPIREMGTVRGSLNLQDSVENSFREKLVIQVTREEGDRIRRRGRGRRRRSPAGRWGQ
jgi:hypothetical protein